MNTEIDKSTIAFGQLTEAGMLSLWPVLEGLSSDQQWMAWGEANYTKTLPRKWELSRTVVVNDQVLGYCLCSVRGGFLWIHRLVVGQASRGKGLGGVFVREMQRVAKGAGLLGIFLKTPVENVQGVLFYKDNGFREVSNENGHVVLMAESAGDVAVGIHQPNYLPWLGYFYKMSISNVFIFLDDADFPKGSYVNRNKICINGEGKWLTVPTGGGLKTPILHVCPAGSEWAQKHIRTLEVVYGRAPFFNEYFPAISAILSEKGSLNFADLNIALIKYVASHVGVDCIFLRSSEMNVSGLSDARLVQLVSKVGGHTYISGSGGANYQTEEIYQEHGIKLQYSNYKAEAYPQGTSEFIAGLGVLDALFNVGAEQIAATFKQLAQNR
ncbi:hypothetical protein CCOS865_01697 [Pseudomonas reidholzensis]|uniref:N-acetyltransferase domain-containing protein n=1 Tax=Pseudomonas reidholzensis TaxID=1785162 RepID=A0A383RS19_9PSED|nr:WbqC family protein [Pseudomonas reidholzensis]SYX89444.1 hypothetical protein CCOS865_01697 [Pseudomonas reidholzensis]